MSWFKKKDKAEKAQKANEDKNPEQEAPEVKAEEPAAQPEEAAPAEEDAPPASSRQEAGFGAKLKDKLAKTRDVLNTPIEDFFITKTELTEDSLEELEETLITADMGVNTVMDLMEPITEKVNKKQITNSKELRAALTDAMLDLIKPVHENKELPNKKPLVIMVVGVNGVGKTTTIGKLAANFKKQGKKVMLVAGDTFRAAAVEQLEIWAQRTGVQIVRHRDNSDPAAVAYDGVAAAEARGMDVVIIDTAGRLHTQVNLMEELKKIRRSCHKSLPGSPHETWLVIDANTGQNAVSQAKLFHEAIGVTGMVLTKVDGTAKGGIVVSICHDMDVPIRYIGLGEKAEDLREFEAREFIKALF
ncbi:signal recognition particle-docking protein FtsY [Desulfatibacillum alkenivorans DSM 16219]|jgi:fused signal recognition particle receptor|uniref:Signal recognition particle receptor FtsY n=1 Tax=Desulfatibacillum alkenivorans DSM 16219 TaxID=1121393 RepID=A0A1M6SQY1_9BACT|nr:signal recognition particle-docking protein FtsY [Desulfatibacillum alkenivorans]SHK47066.1 signal recognition particle-docking protein FtsY [Desulfatibacillum alkenivorans DSM 16219]